MGLTAVLTVFQIISGRLPERGRKNTCLGKSCLLGLPRVPFANVFSGYMIVFFCFNVEDRRWSILFYPIILEGCRGSTDDFTTFPFHLVLFSAAFVELAKTIPVHSLILSSHLFFCLPLFLFPFTVLCRTVFAEREDLGRGQTILISVSCPGPGVHHFLQWLLGSFSELAHR